MKYKIFTMGSLSPPATCLTAPSFKATLLMVELSLSATNRNDPCSVCLRVRPEGWANAAFSG